MSQPPLVRLGLLLVVAASLGGLLARRAGRPTGAADPVRLSQAIAYMEARLARDPRNPIIAGQLANRYILRFGTEAHLQDIERAETLARTALALAKDTSSALGRVAGILLMQHKFQASLEAARGALRADTGSAEAYGVLLETALATGEYELADRAAGRLDPVTVSGQIQRAQWLDARGETRGAYPLMHHACAELERSGTQAMVIAWCLTQLAAMDETLRGPDEAEALLRYILTIQPGYRGALERLGRLALARGAYREAARFYEPILSDAHPDLYLRMAEAKRGIAESGAAEHFETRFLAVAGRPEHEALFGNMLASFYAQRGHPGDLDSALALARHDLARRPTNEAYDLLSWVHYRRGELGQALAASDRALRWGRPTTLMRQRREVVLRAISRPS